jgi:hypothetical protein
VEKGIDMLDMAESKGEACQEARSLCSSAKSKLPREDCLELLECLAAALEAAKS